MNDTYRLKDLLKFWKGQKKLDFQGIKVLLEIFERNKVSKERKRWIIIAGLRGLGLYEVGYEKPTLEDILREDEEVKKQEDLKKNDVPGEIKWQRGSSDVGIDTYKCRILNGTMEFWKILN